MTTRRPLGTGPAPAAADDQNLSPGASTPRAALAAERLEGAPAPARPPAPPTGERRLLGMRPVAGR
ncbi:hypothetical protein ACIF6K_30340 [Streptomyces sp. NPDC085942]|uniref:hypothetical protein n=1 Tax=Streptomyces sp. NPDC085942 TaxID=3365743 RepID=UPI0037CDD30A